MSKVAFFICMHVLIDIPVGANDEIGTPDQVLRTLQHSLAAVKQHLGQAGQRILNEGAQGVLQPEPHQRHQPEQLGKLVHHPRGLVNVVRAQTVQVGTDAVAQRNHPRLREKQANLEKEEENQCVTVLVCYVY